MIRCSGPIPEITMGEPCTDPVFIEQLRVASHYAEINRQWYSDHAAEIGSAHHGRFIAVAGGELFVGDDIHEVRRRAGATHPVGRGGIFVKYIRPKPGV